MQKPLFTGVVQSEKCFKKPDLSKVKIDSYQKLNNESYIFSSYLDRRMNVVRAIGAVHWNISSKPIYCLLWYESETKPEVTNASVQHWDWDHW